MELHFSLLQGCDGQAIAVDLRTDIYHPHYRYPRLFRAHRRHPHAAHRRVAGPVQHSDAAVADVELIPGTIPRQASRDRHRPACCRQHAIGRLPLAAVLRQPGHNYWRDTDPHLPARLLPRRRALPGTQVGAETAAARRLQGRLVLPQDLRQPAQARQRHGPAPTIWRIRLHRHRHGPVDGGRIVVHLTPRRGTRACSTPACASPPAPSPPSSTAAPPSSWPSSSTHTCRA